MTKKMNLKTNNVSASVKQSTVMPSKYDTFAAIEFKFKEILFKHLILSNFSGEISHGEYLFNRVSNLHRYLLQTNSNKKLLKTYSNFKFIKRRPDFIIHSVGLIIEIDGVIHDTEKRVKKDYLRIEEYKSLGYEVIIFENKDIANSNRRNFIIKDLTKLISDLKQDQNLENRLGKIRKNQSNYRNSYLSKNGASSVLISKKSPAYLNCLYCAQENGGYRYNFNIKSKSYLAERLKYLQHTKPLINFNPSL